MKLMLISAHHEHVVLKYITRFCQGKEILRYSIKFEVKNEGDIFAKTGTIQILYMTQKEVAIDGTRF